MQNRYYATGRRKEAVARVYLYTPGEGKIIVNKKEFGDYFGGNARCLRKIIEFPLEVVNLVGKVDIKARLNGGGITGQAGALRHGIARALVAMDLSFRPLLKKYKLLTRDPRMKERKKYGRKGRRRGFQWTKR